MIRANCCTRVHSRVLQSDIRQRLKVNSLSTQLTTTSFLKNIFMLATQHWRRQLWGTGARALLELARGHRFGNVYLSAVGSGRLVVNTSTPHIFHMLLFSVLTFSTFAICTCLFHSCVFQPQYFRFPYLRFSAPVVSLYSFLFFLLYKCRNFRDIYLIL